MLLLQNCKILPRKFLFFNLFLRKARSITEFTQHLNKLQRNSYSTKEYHNSLMHIVKPKGKFGKLIE